MRKIRKNYHSISYLSLIIVLLLAGCINNQENFKEKNNIISVGKIGNETEIFQNNSGMDEEKNNTIKINVSENEEVKLKRRGKIWHYQLQNVDFDNIKNLNVDYLVIDIDDAKLTKKQIDYLNERGITVLSYLSIGEAEDYRSYWKGYWRVGHPNFVVEENPKWKGNYVVRYWERDWQRIIFNQLDKIIANGYNGVYLDKIDSYEYFEGKQPNAKEEMISFVKRIKDLAISKNSDFLVFTQNAVELYDYEDFANSIDGVGKEDTWWNEKGKINEGGLKYLIKMKKDGKVILVVDYPTEKNKVCSFYNECWKYGFYCVVENRELDRKYIECENK